eukprot:GHVU01205335.1.p2 GENE.GHVU01205335.1~~GHVU01205335.1.p2  ORF type:complete len:145 (+),score=7.26 GHVU01205335.1:266-700(+)
MATTRLEDANVASVDRPGWVCTEPLRLLVSWRRDGASSLIAACRYIALVCLRACTTVGLRLYIYIYVCVCVHTGGSFGEGVKAKRAEVVAFLVYASLILLGINWAVLYVDYNYGGRAAHLSTAYVRYSYLEVPSFIICPYHMYV